MLLTLVYNGGSLMLLYLVLWQLTWRSPTRPCKIWDNLARSLGNSRWLPVPWQQQSAYSFCVYWSVVHTICYLLAMGTVDKGCPIIKPTVPEAFPMSVSSLVILQSVGSLIGKFKMVAHFHDNNRLANGIACSGVQSVYSVMFFLVTWYVLVQVNCPWNRSDDKCIPLKVQNLAYSLQIQDGRQFP